MGLDDVLDAYVYGFVLTELTLPFDEEEGASGFVEEIQDLIDPASYPHLIEQMTEQVVGQDDTHGQEFGFGLDLVLDSHLAEGA